VGLSGVIAVAAGAEHSVALRWDGTVWAWGSNANGQLGTGSGAHSPVRVRGQQGFVAIAAGRRHTVALKKNGQVWAWGRNADGQLGDGTTTDRSAPVQVGGLDSVVAIAAGDAHLAAGDLRFEPPSALASGDDGLDAIREIASGAPSHLEADGSLLLEHGLDQGERVRVLLQQAGFADVQTTRDLEGRDRVSSGRWPGSRSAA
jgi:hypothetical protein